MRRKREEKQQQPPRKKQKWWPLRLARRASICWCWGLYRHSRPYKNIRCHCQKNWFLQFNVSCVFVWNNREENQPICRSETGKKWHRFEMPSDHPWRNTGLYSHTIVMGIYCSTKSGYLFYEERSVLTNGYKWQNNAK